MKHTAGRRWSIRLLLVLGTILLVLSIFAIWANRQLFNADNWADTSGAVLENEAVQTQLAGFLVDELYDNVDVAGELAAVAPPRLAPLAGPVAGALRNAAEPAIKKVLDRPRLQEAWQTANRLTAQQFINVADGNSKIVTANGDTVVLNLRRLLIDIVGRLGLPGVLAGKIPENAGAITVLKADQVSYIQDGAAAVRGLAIWLPAIALSCLALAVWLATGRRRRVLMWAGIDLILAGGIVLVARNILGGTVVDTLAASESAKPAAQAVWDIGSDLLRQVAQASVVLGIPVVFGALLAGSTKPAVGARRFMAPSMRDRPAVVWGAAALIVLLVIWWGPIPATRNPVLMLIIAALFALGVEMLRRQTIAEFPADAPDEEKSKLVERARAAAKSVAGRGTFDQRTGAPAAVAVAPVTAAPAGGTDPVERLERLEALHERGVLTDAEFERQKTLVLSP